MFGTSTNLTTLTFPVPSGAVTLTYPNTSEYMVGANSDTTTTHVLHATTVAGVGNFAAIAAGDLPAALSSSTSINKVTITAPATSATLTIADGTTLTETFSMNVAKTAGVAGAIPWYDTTTTESASALLTQYGVMIGGGASAAPSTIAADTTTTHALFATAGAPAFRAVAAGDIQATAIPPVAVPTPGTSITLAGPAGIAVCTGTCTVSVPVPAAGYQFCILNDDNVGTAITLSALGSSARYENSARTAYGTAGTGTLVLSAATGNLVCIAGRDSTHYLTTNYVGTVTVN